MMDQLAEKIYVPPEIVLFGAGVLCGYLNRYEKASALTAMASPATLVIDIPYEAGAPQVNLYGPAFGMGIATGLMLRKYGLPPQLKDLKKYLPMQ